MTESTLTESPAEPPEAPVAPEMEPGLVVQPPRVDHVEPSVPTPQPPMDETDRLDPQPVQMVLVSGTEFDLEALRLRQFLRLLRIVTRGAADVLDTSQLDLEDPQGFVQQFLGMVLFSIPEAEEETIEFIKSMVRPKNLTGNPDKDLIKVQDLSAELDNPELEDTITIIQCVVEHEGEDLRALGKRLAAMFKAAQKMGADRPDKTQG